MDNNEDDIDQLNLGDEEVKVDLYNENNENENENDNNDNNNSLEKSKNDNQLSYRYTIVDKNFDEDKMIVELIVKENQKILRKYQYLLLI